MYLSCLALVVSNSAIADELDKFKDDASRYYDQLTADYKVIGEKSKTLAEDIIDSTIQASILNVDGAFEYTFDRVYGSYQKVQGCLTRHRALANPLIDFISTEPSAEAERQDYWVRNYDASRVNVFSSAMSQIQFTYGDCLGDIQRIRDFIYIMKSYKDQNLNICQSLEKNLEYKSLTDHLPLDYTAIGRLKNDWWRYVPAVTITGSIPQAGCSDAIAPGCYSKGYVSIEAARNQTSVENSYAVLKAYYPELAAASYLSFLALMNGYSVGTPENPGSSSGLPILPKQPDSISHMGEANLVANLVWLAGTYIQTQEIIRRVNDINQWIARKEAELRATINSSIISEAQFSEMKKSRCQEQAGFIDERVTEVLTFLSSASTEESIGSYLSEVIAIQTWYNSLFLTFLDRGIFDQIAKDEVIRQRNEIYKRLNAAKMEADFASTRQAIDSTQQDIARERCVAGSSNSTTVRNLTRLVNRYNSFCENALSLYGYATEKIPLQGTDEGKVRCIYDGFDEAVKSISITNDSGNSSRVQAFDAQGNLIFTIGNVSSRTQDSERRLQNSFYCAVVGPGEFGTLESNRLKEGSYQLANDESLGIAAASMTQMKEHVKHKAELIRNKISRCNSTLNVIKKIELPESNSCRIYGDQQ
jgi:hypothetical protein